MKISNVFTPSAKEQKSAKTAKPKAAASGVEQKKKEAVKPAGLADVKRAGFGAHTAFVTSFHITEKATDLLKNKQYVFKVKKNATKKDVREAVEDLYKVNVLGVQIINIPEKTMRWRGGQGMGKGYKKAIVKIKAGQDIEILQR